MGRLYMAVVACNYQEVDRQLKEQFIHGLYYKYMLEEIIKELTTAKWWPHNQWWHASLGKKSRSTEGPGSSFKHHYRVEAIWQCKDSEEAKRWQHKRSTRSEIAVTTMLILWQSTLAKAMSSIWKDVCGLWQDQTLQEGMLQQERLGGKWTRARGITRIQWGRAWDSEYWFSTFE